MDIDIKMFDNLKGKIRQAHKYGLDSNCNQLSFILVKKLISSHEIKRNTSVDGKCLLFFYSDFILQNQML